MYQPRDREFSVDRGGGEAIVWPASLVHAGATIVRRTPWWSRLDPGVDLGEAIGSPAWCRGAATLVAMVVALLHVAPGLSVFPVERAIPDTPARYRAPAGPASSSIASSEKPIGVFAPALRRAPVVTDGPVRLTGIVGTSLYGALRASGAAAPVAADYIRAFAPRIDIGDIDPTDRFEIVVQHDSSTTGGARDGRLLYAAIVHLGQPLSLMRWTFGGSDRWFDAAGTGVSSDGFTVPVADARVTSEFGMRFHPILGFSRMHQGVDLAAPLGTPIVAAAEGIVRFAGAHGGYGNFVQIQNDGGMGTGYGHMSDIVVHPGQVVRQGELIGYVGSTGLSTGPHCHFEVYRNGVAVDPQTAQFAAAPQLGGEALLRFRIALAKVVALPVTS